MNNEGFISTKETRKLLGVTTKTLINWSKTGKNNIIKSPSGIRLYSIKDIQNILGCNIDIKEKKKIVYYRVSSNKQKDDLERQKDFFRHEYPDHLLVEDIGSRKENVLKPFWNNQRKEISQKLWLPTETDCVDLVSNSYSGSLKSMALNSLFSIEKITNPMIKNSQTTFSPSFTSTLVDKWVEEDIRCRKIRIYPTTNQKKMFKNWIDTFIIVLYMHLNKVKK